jgi:hypothetical protein
MKDWNGNSNSIYKTLGASNHTEQEREENDYYATDPIAIDKLLKVEQPSNFIYECACGEGHLSERLKQYGFEVYSSDIVDRGYYSANIKDFFEQKEIASYFDILTNPPYKFAKEFVLKALDLVDTGRKVFMFLKLQFLEGKARYNELFSKHPPKNIYVFSERVMCAKNGDFEKMKAGGGSAVAYAWFVWEKGFVGQTVIKWI